MKIHPEISAYRVVFYVLLIVSTHGGIGGNKYTSVSFPVPVERTIKFKYSPNVAEKDTGIIFRNSIRGIKKPDR
jgi:hypothetical protein